MRSPPGPCQREQEDWCSQVRRLHLRDSGGPVGSSQLPDGPAGSPSEGVTLFGGS